MLYLWTRLGVGAAPPGKPTHRPQRRDRDLGLLLKVLGAHDETAAAAMNAAAAVPSTAAKGVAFDMNIRPERVVWALVVATKHQRSAAEQDHRGEAGGQRDGHAIAV